ncbi:MAG: hypothetical protein LBJ65_14950 [Burkholderia sp.]|jgi:hypothetical protein|uniref:hypothetical protein n=1 Tax=Burkholderia sp. TaxID=36773 RepID=UPI00282958B6|nr:hypothetical protein [Burkholderia sp.]MDR0242896.1 hypothetical protein [Burkholderia sp.]
MNTPELTLTDPEGVRLALLSDDEDIRAQFATHLGAELDRLVGVLAHCFEWMAPITEAADHVGTQQTALAAGFGLGTLDDLLVATKLLLAGKLAAAGNVMRQVIEGIAMSILCAADGELILEYRKKSGAVRGCYWERAWRSDPSVQAHHALKQLDWNAAQLGVLPQAVEVLARSKKHYNQFSHCGWATIASRAVRNTPGLVYLGGHFDEGKLDVYRDEMQQRIGLCRVLPRVLDHHVLSMMAPAAGEEIAAANPPNPA